MAIVRKSQLKTMGKEDLNKRLAEIRLDLSKESANISVGMPKNPGKVREMRRTIARILTYMNHDTSIPKKPISLDKSQGAAGKEDVKK